MTEEQLEVFIAGQAKAIEGLTACVSTVRTLISDSMTRIDKLEQAAKVPLSGAN